MPNLTRPPASPRAFPALAAVLTAFCLAATGCAADATEPSETSAAPSPVGPLEPSEPFGLTTLTLQSPGDAAEVEVPAYDAFEPATRQRGLMGRAELPNGTGMIFRFPGEHAGGFWMKNTLIPLSIAYLDERGTVVSVMDMEPCTHDPCPSYDPDVPYTAAVEVNQGFFDEVGLRVGWQVDVPQGLPAPS